MIIESSRLASGRGFPKVQFTTRCLRNMYRRGVDVNINTVRRFRKILGVAAYNYQCVASRPRVIFTCARLMSSRTIAPTVCCISAPNLQVDREKHGTCAGCRRNARHPSHLCARMGVTITSASYASHLHRVPTGDVVSHSGEP